jgi:hypothetical protein
MKRSHVLFIIALGIIAIVMQLPFVSADPDMNISTSRDASTDEGLNTCQIRNFVNHGDLTLNKSDNFVKTPMFGAVLFFPFKIFGATHSVGRLSILLLSLGICLSIFSYNKYYQFWGLCSFIIVFGESYIFHYFHFCMAEILSTVLIFLSIFMMVKPFKTKPQLRAGFFSATFISLAYLIKIQFLYGVLILPLAITLFILFGINDKKILLKQLIYTVAFLIMYLIIYYLLWYLPNKSFFLYVMADQTTDRFVSFSNLATQINVNIQNIFYNGYLKLFTYSFYVLYIIGVVYCFFTKPSIFRLLFIGLSCWILIELHKLSMTYLPTRYLISLLFSMGLIMSLVLNEIFFIKGRSASISLIKVFSILFLLAFGINNFKDYFLSYNNRTYDILSVDNYLSHYDLKNKPVIGAWAPSLSWKCNAISFPIWKDYFNDTDVLVKYEPAVIIAEIDEEDSNQAFSSRGIAIDASADSIKYFNLNRWKIKLLWIKQSTNSISYQ